MNSTIKIGQAPNLPYWRALSMTAEEIKTYNDGFMQELEMKDVHYCPKCDKVVPNYLEHDCLISVGIEKSEGAKLAEATMSKTIADYPNNVYGKQIWNEAIEAAAKVCEINSAADVRKLKK